MTKSKKTLSDVALERAQEVQELAVDPMATRTRLYNGLAGVRAGDPQLALQLEEHYLTRIMYLAAHAPKQPAFVSPMTKRSPWKPSDAVASSFARRYAAAQAPDILIDEVAQGRVSSETVDTVKTLYPRYWEAYKDQAARELMMSKNELPYAKRAALAKAFDLETIEPTLNPQFHQAYTSIIEQTSAAEEEDPNQKTGRRGGYQLSRQINSDKAAPKPTPAQKTGG